MFDLKQITTLLIDMDGTVVDSLPQLKLMYYDFLKRNGIEGTDQEFKELNGAFLSDAIKMLNEKYRLHLDTDQASQDFIQRLRDYYAKEAVLFRGVEDFLSYAKKMGLKTALVTSASPIHAEALLKGTNIARFFDAIITPNSKVIKGKPDPAIYLEALKVLNVKPNEAIAVEDASNGVRAAVSANIYTYHIFSEKLPNDLEGENLVKKVADWSEILNAFWRINEPS
ncbi:MAG: HAD family phosphatase [Chlamydiota bacterium]|nr:HAD family phosphatase [Chlamydiota bacterium]